MKFSALIMSIVLLLALVIAPEPHQPLPRAEAATFTVDTLVDESDGDFSAGDFSLREAVEQANDTAGADVINFSVSGTIILDRQLVLTRVLTINGSAITLDGGNATRIMTVVSTATATLNDLTFQNGFTSGLVDGGAIFNYGTLEITGSTFNGNTAGRWGGAINNSNGILTVNGSSFSDNDGFVGGAINNSDGTLTVNNSTFSGNYAYQGGAIRNDDGTSTINNSTFNNNHAQYSGAIDIYYGSLTINNSTLNGNTATYDGGAIWVFGGQVAINRSTFNNNIAESSTGGAIRNNLALAIYNSTFSDNIAALGGGAIYNSGSGLQIHSSTFSNNISTDMTNGGLYDDPGGGALIISTLFADNICAGSIVDGGNNIAYNATGCPGMVANPQLGPLQNNGGPTDTMLPALTGPAVDAYAAPCATIFDQRGISRPQGECDIGATEQENIIALNTSAACIDENLSVTITSGDGPFNITASAGINTPANGVGVGVTTINGPEKWDDVTVTETGGDTESINLGQFKCRTDERPVPIWPSHRYRTTNPHPYFAWTAVSFANNYRVFVFDDANAASRTVDIRENSGGPTNLTLSATLPDGRLFWRVRGRTNRVWGLWSVRFTLFKDPAPISVNTPAPTIDLNLPSGGDSLPIPVPTLPPPPNSR